MDINELAIKWWLEHFAFDDKRDQFAAALRKHLPDGDWVTYNDYDPNELLLNVVREFMECSGYMFSGRGIFPTKTGIMREDDRLLAKEGYGYPGFGDVTDDLRDKY